ncbi:NAD(P)/FAD-dependent oxidoreductase [Candidatus Peregrinibacteria bacterium]|nr:NAD(P)/FAD-dependent oxidoreductase [Candidatus Peregrinibacteria bacterium]
MTYDCAIVGAGPAGIAAAVQLKRSGAGIALFECREVGGLMRNALLVENYLGFPAGVDGNKLATLFMEQLESLSILPFHEEVIAIAEDAESLLIRTANGSHRCANAIIATGTTPRRACIDGEEQLEGRSLFYEIRDMPEDGRGRAALVVGGGDIGFDYALHLQKRGYKPLIVARSGPRCAPLLRRRASECGIRCIEKSLPKAVRQTGGMLEVSLDDELVPTDYILVAAGRKPRLVPISARNRAAVSFAGDVRNGLKRHIHIASGDGVRAAIKMLCRISKLSNASN